MLCITGVEDLFMYEVLDTDDLVTSVVSRAYIREALEAGVVIYGAELIDDDCNIEIYNQADKRKVQLYLQYNINVNYADNTIFRMEFNSVRESYKLRLSDFCGSIADDALIYRNNTNNKITLIFDSSLRFSKKAINRLLTGRHVGLKLDISELSDGLADIIYSRILVHYSYNTLIDGSIIDGDERWGRYVAAWALLHGQDLLFSDLKIKKISGVCEPVSAGKWLVDKYKFDLKNSYSSVSWASLNKRSILNEARTPESQLIRRWFDLFGDFDECVDYIKGVIRNK